MTFFDGYWYCYASAAAMFLSSTGHEISPRVIEVVSGVGIGGTFITEEGLAYFGNYATFKGVTKAMEILGFAVETAAQDDPTPVPFDRLEKLLESSPVLVGPLDMRYLEYNPDRMSDEHYIVVDRIEGDRVFVHDPCGFPHVFIGRASFARAWRADVLDRKTAFYRHWANPLRLTSPPDGELYDRAMVFFKEVYRQAEERARNGQLIGKEAMVLLATLTAAGKLNRMQRGHLTHFVVPLGAKRALDYACFFQPHHATLHRLTTEQAKIFGTLQGYLVKEEWEGAGAEFAKLAELEGSIKDAVLRN